VLDRSLERLARLDAQFGNRIRTLHATAASIEEAALDADLVIGAVLIRGAATPRLLERATIARLRPGSVLVDVAIDQGGCFATSRPTTHEQPTFTVDGVVHYCVANMPGAVPRTSTFALNNATLPHVLALADKGWRQALRDDPHLRNGLNAHAGAIACTPVAEALGLPAADPAALLAG
jgi:alanine dehydrogenase